MRFDPAHTKQLACATVFNSFDMNIRLRDQLLQFFKIEKNAQDRNDFFQISYTFKCIHYGNIYTK